MVLGSPADVLAAIPYLVGFHPEESLVLVAMDGCGPGRRLVLTVRTDLPLQDGWDRRLLPVLEREGVEHVILAGYGPEALVTPATHTVIRRLGEAGVGVREALRAQDGRYWSYMCRSASCCPPEGSAYDVASSRVAAQATVAGLVALPDRAALARTVAPAEGLTRASMREATAREIAAFRTALAEAADPADFTAAFVAEGLAAVRDAIARAEAGDRLADDEAARLGLHLAVMRVRDEAWLLTDAAEHATHATLWSDLTHRLEAPFVPPAASLLAIASWQRGACTLAATAVDRALSINPRYMLARLLMHGLQACLPPAVVTAPMTTTALNATMGSPHPTWLTPLLSLLPPPEAPRLAG
ncbi:DUF4192 domain-containing protein [Bailinhaonella thermotolerans]|uniref:DUF4192 domain-containing protein n=2 Tax=Bailinhaonella thermotolerans TaxID=1070861 RepID=A0A3A4BAC2_9ACTN|nr:DUF4192 domain-containing protein [Bailinhaonella thermotolerans]